jgi:hypothetical protein
MISNKSGRNASSPWLACPPQSKSINISMAVFVYIPIKEVSESIQSGKKIKKRKEKNSITGFAPGIL